MECKNITSDIRARAVLNSCPWYVSVVFEGPLDTLCTKLAVESRVPSGIIDAVDVDVPDTTVCTGESEQERQRNEIEYHFAMFRQILSLPML